MTRMFGGSLDSQDLTCFEHPLGLPAQGLQIQFPLRGLGGWWQRGPSVVPTPSMPYLPK